MQNLLRFLTKYHFIILFLLLEIICIFLIGQNNPYQKTKLINSANLVTGNVYSFFSGIRDFVNLKEQNEQLAKENAMLRDEITEYSYQFVPRYINDTIFVMDTLVLDSTTQYSYNTAKVISNSINKQYNQIYLNKGSEHGFLPDMGVINMQGVVGVVTSVSNNYSIVMPVVNRDFNLSVRLKDLGYFGNLSWDGKDYRFAQISDVPSHIVPIPGDTVVTSGYSDIFPEGVVVGFVSDFDQEVGNGFLKIKIEIAADLGNVSYVYGIENTSSNELENLKNE